MRIGRVVLLALLALAGLAVGVGLGRSLFGGGVPLDQVAELVRAGGDSAVTAYRTNVEDVVGELRDSIEYYQAEARLAARLEVRRAPVKIEHDTVTLPAVPAGASSAVVPLYLDTLGVHLAEELTIAPAPTSITRTLELTFDPDTLAVALLRLPSGLDRVTAAASSLGLEVGVVNAAQVIDRRGKHWFGWDVLYAGACVATGVAAGNELAGNGGTASTVVLAAGGLGCTLGTLMRF